MKINKILFKTSLLSLLIVLTGSSLARAQGPMDASHMRLWFQLMTLDMNVDFLPTKMKCNPPSIKSY